jgi:hypothetical protein
MVGMKPDPDLGRVPIAASIKLRKLVQYLDRHLDRLVAVLLIRDWRSENRHEPVSEELVNDPLISIDAVDHELEERVQVVHNFCRVRFLRERGEVPDVQEHQADVPHLAVPLDVLGQEPVDDLW